MVIKPGEQEILLYLFRGYKLHKRIADEANSEKVPINFDLNNPLSNSLPILSLKGYCISKNIYRGNKFVLALKRLREAGLVMVFKEPSNVDYGLRKSPEAYKRGLKELKRKGYLPADYIQELNNLASNKNGVKQLKMAGLIKQKHQKVIYLTPEGRLFAEVLERLS